MLLTAAAVTGFITNSAISQVNDLLQANIEALANDEYDIGQTQLDCVQYLLWVGLHPRRRKQMPPLIKNQFRRVSII